jgi:hypothetical protein
MRLMVIGKWKTYIGRLKLGEAWVRQGGGGGLSVYEEEVEGDDVAGVVIGNFIIGLVYLV